MKTVFVLGAGPAGLFAAQKVALAGHQVLLFNRDIKPGGLAEYGIYPTKDKMKIGLRKQFAKVLSLPNVHYLGHVAIGTDSTISIPELREFSPAAMIFAVGAQGTKKLSLPGSDSRGVYSAKDFVYHYNLLPPFATQDFSTGKRVAVVGMGNVAVDIARWLLQDAPNRKTEEVIVVARRGPFEAKFDQKEFAYIERHLDRDAFEDELKRIRDPLAAVGQDIEKVREATFPVLAKPLTEAVDPRLRFRFLSSPLAILAGEDGRIQRLTVGENILVERNGDVAARATSASTDIDVDTMIFAIGDVADPGVGLPYGSDGYVTNPDHSASDSKSADSNPADSHSNSKGEKRAAYEVFDSAGPGVLEGTYVVGWARKASEGLVGIARHDGEQGAAHVLKYLEGVPEPTLSSSPASLTDILHHLDRKSVRVVGKPDLDRLARAEEAEALERNVPWFKFADDDIMLTAIEQRLKAVCS